MTSSNLTLERLLAGGYFPEALPPCFRTETFGAPLKSGQTIVNDFDASTKVTVQSKWVKYNRARVGLHVGNSPYLILYIFTLWPNVSTSLPVRIHAVLNPPPLLFNCPPRRVL